MLNKNSNQKDCLMKGINTVKPNNGTFPINLGQIPVKDDFLKNGGYMKNTPEIAFHVIFDEC